VPAIDPADHPLRGDRVAANIQSIEGNLACEPLTVKTRNSIGQRVAVRAILPLPADKCLRKRDFPATRRLRACRWSRAPESAESLKEALPAFGGRQRHWRRKYLPVTHPVPPHSRSRGGISSAEEFPAYPMRDRRRRLLPEDAARSAAAPDMRVTDGGDAQQLYSDAARAARQRGIHSLVPLRGWMLALAISGMLLAVGGLFGLHLAADRMQATLGRAAAGSLRIDRPASLSAWLASTLLAAAAGLSLFIFSLRRHRIDDYHGRYRMWILVAMACAVGNLFEASSLAAIVHSLCSAACGATGLRADLIGPAAMTTLVAGLVLRLGIEIRRCAPAMTTLVLACLAFGVAAATNFGWPVAHSPAMFPLWLRGSWLLGYVLLVTTLLLYSRRVQLEVAGAVALPVRVKRKKPASKTADADDEESRIAERPARKLKLRTDLDPVDRSADADEQTAAPAPKLALGGKSPAASSSGDHSNDAKRLSRADRRKLRHEQHRMAS